MIKRASRWSDNDFADAFFLFCLNLVITGQLVHILFYENEAEVADVGKNKNKEEFMKIFSINLRKVFQSATFDFNSLQEIRLRAEAPMIFRFPDGKQYLTKGNRLCSSEKDAVMIPINEIRETMEYISNYSMYAYEEEMKRGYLTIEGGHRIGIAGKMLCENGDVRGVKQISCLCIRLAHEVIGCSDRMVGLLLSGDEFQDTLILSPPGFGKTTLLRDLIRNLSDGGYRKAGGYQIGLVDERSEIAACYLGIPQNDIGKNTDIYDSCPKATGIQYLLRSMSPQIIAVDEIAGDCDLKAVEQAFGCGCRILATTHAGSMEELMQKPHWKKVFSLNIFKRFIVIEKHGKNPQYRVLNQEGREVSGGKI